jgi:choline dehydrogenase
MLPTSIDPVNATRSNSTTAYYGPASRRPNFTLLTGCQVRRILCSRGNQNEIKATGVEIRWRGNVLSISARGEVILSAGKAEAFMYAVW